MEDNLLKKQFNSRDVNRLRSIVKGSLGDKSGISVGYDKGEIIRYEGDIWEEDGRVWTIKDGIKQNIPKNKNFKNIPIFCPSCNKVLKDIDVKFYKQHGRCLNCQSLHETHLKLNGEWSKYKDEIINGDIDGFIEEYTAWVEEEINKVNGSSYITESGDQEIWLGNIKNKLLKDKEEIIQYLNTIKKNGD
jgi:hypothetical protein